MKKLLSFGFNDAHTEWMLEVHHHYSNSDDSQLSTRMAQVLTATTTPAVPRSSAETTRQGYHIGTTG